MIDWDALETQALEQQNCIAFADLSSRFVPGEGDNPTAMIIGEAPGATEAITRRPFVGPAGQVLRELMDIAGLKADSRSYAAVSDPPNCWLTNVVKFRPPKNRKPEWAEVQAARPWLREEWLAIGSPKLIIPVGGTALTVVTGRQSISILRAAGKCHAYKSRLGPEMYIWPMVHPSFGLRNPEVQPLLEQDWEALGVWRNEFESTGGA